MPLTDAACKNAKPREKAYRLSDGQGLFLLIRPTGSKAWQWFYRFGDRQRTLTLGNYPAITLAESRDLRVRAAKVKARGTDPMDAQAGLAGEGRSFEEVARAHIRVWKVGKSDSHVSRVVARLEKDAFPVIGSKDVADIGRDEILALVRKVEDRGAIDVSKRLKQKISEVYAFAIAEGKADRDPTIGLDKALMPKPKVKHRAMVGAKGLGNLALAIGNYDGDDATRLALEFTLLTGVRTSETRFMEWGEVEGDELWRLSPARMKMHREHLVPLSRQAREILTKARASSPRSKLVFPGDGGKAMSENTMLFALYRMGFRSKQTVHGFRRLFSTVLNENGFNRDWVELQLAHGEDDEIRGAYNAAEYLLQRTEMMQWWADHVGDEKVKAVLG